MLDITYPRLDPRTIEVTAETRQRQENMGDVEDLKQSILMLRKKSPASGGFIHPIVVRLIDDKPKLVAGGRRHKAALELGLPDVPIRYFDELNDEEAEIIELEENVKRKELTWRDHVRAIGRIHLLYKKRANGWKVEQTAEAVSLHPSHLRKILHVFDALEGGRINKAESVEQAYNMLHRFSERKAESVVADIIVNGAKFFGETIAPAPVAPPDDTFTIATTVAILDETPNGTALGHAPINALSMPPAVGPPAPTPVAPRIDPIINANFCEWIKTYSGPKFSLIHCDFPYGNYRGGDSKGSLAALDTEDFYDNNESVYWTLLDALTTDLDRIMSYSAHLLFWFNMNFYTETVTRLRKAGLFVHDHPIIWHKTGGPGGLGVVPGTAVTYPRRTYDTALLAVRGNRPLAKPGMNSYAAPTAGNKIHPSQKPEPMLRFFLQMLVDETTSVFDPTCGSGAALRAAEDLGARSILGLELDPSYASSANTKTLQARILRQAGTSRRED